MKLLPPIAACLCAFAFPLAAQVLEVIPNRVMADESAAIRVKGLQPNERITIRAELVDGAGHEWVSHAEFVADAQGIVDASQQAPSAGSYKKVSPMGLIWSMLPTSKNVAIYQSMRDLAPQPIEFHLMRKGEKIASARLDQVTIPEGVQRIPAVCAISTVGPSA